MNVLFPAFFMIGISSLLIWSMYSRTNSRNQEQFAKFRFFYMGSYCELEVRVFRILCFIFVRMMITPESMLAKNPQVSLSVFAKERKIVKLPDIFDNFSSIGIAKKSTPLSIEVRHANRIIKRRIG